MAASKTNDHNKSQIQRHLSVHFSTSFTKGIAHTEVLEEIEKLVEKNLRYGDESSKYCQYIMSLFTTDIKQDPISKLNLHFYTELCKHNNTMFTKWRLPKQMITTKVKSRDICQYTLVQALQRG
jgi:hypothetical protein